MKVLFPERIRLALRNLKTKEPAETGAPDDQDSCVKKAIRKKLSGRRNRSFLRRNTFFTALLKAPGSLTVEASVVIPLFLIVITGFFSLFGAMVTQLKLQTGMERAGKEIAALSYVNEALKKNPDKKNGILQAVGADLALTVISEGAVKELVKARIGDYADELYIAGGENGVSFLGTRYSAAEQEIIITASYKLNAFFLPVSGFRVSQQSVRRAFTGKEAELHEEEEIVYITEYGKTYHTSLSCNYLDLSIASVSLSLVGTRRSADGKIYRECEICHEDGGEEVYITSYGDRYHYDKNCSGLKRSIRSIPISQVGSRTLCKKCKKRDGG